MEEKQHQEFRLAIENELIEEFNRIASQEHPNDIEGELNDLKKSLMSKYDMSAMIQRKWQELMIEEWISANFPDGLNDIDISTLYEILYKKL